CHRSAFFHSWHGSPGSAQFSTLTRVRLRLGACAHDKQRSIAPQVAAAARKSCAPERRASAKRAYLFAVFASAGGASQVQRPAGSWAAVPLASITSLRRRIENFLVPLVMGIAKSIHLASTNGTFSVSLLPSSAYEPRYEYSAAT